MTINDFEQWQHQLLYMGYSHAQIERVNNAGIRDIAAAVDFLDDSRQSDSTDRTELNLANTHTNSNVQSVAPTFAADPRRPSSIANARNSLDNINVSRIPTDSSSVIQQACLGQQRHPSPSVHQNQDDVLRRVLELSRKEQDDREMEQALQMSKQDAAQPNDRDPELIRAIEESLKENDANNPDRNVSWQSQGFNTSENPLRTSLDEPVGLRNIGNTCYLNSLLQVYYYLPNFRRAIMSFRAPDYADQSVFDLTASSNEKFIETDTCPQEACWNESQANPFQLTDDTTAEKTSESTSDWARISPPVHNAAVDVEMEHSSLNPDEKTKVQVDDGSLTIPEAQKLPPSVAATTRAETSVSDKSDNRSERGMDGEKTSERHAVEFVIELQRLFAAMALGHDSCVDPTGVVRAMRDGEGNPIKIGTQQDASEFNHLFLDIVERGLRADQVEKSRGGRNHSGGPGEDQKMAPFGSTTDVVKDMFTLKFKQELQMCVDGVKSDSIATKTSEGETNCIIIDATTSKGRDLHSGLEDYVVARIEYSGRDGSCENEQLGVDNPGTTAQDATAAPVGAIRKTERGLIEAPGKLDAEDADCAMMVDVDAGASSNGTPSCVLKSVWFTKVPPVVVMYLQRVRYIREKAVAEKVYDKYEFGPNITFDRYLIENRVASSRARDRVAGIRKERRRILSLMRKYKFFATTECSSPTRFEDADVVMDSDKAESDYFTFGRRIRDRLLEALKPSSDLFSVQGLSREKVDVAVQTIEQVLEHDKAKYDALNEELGRLETDEQVYDGLDRIKYRLHAVLVHDGAPSGGHYWSFIRDWKTRDSDLTWMKLSDSVVSRVSETEMLKWSVGGHGRASAYCLIYTVTDYTECNCDIPDESRGLLPAMRVQEVDARNKVKSNHGKERTDHAVGTISEMNDGVELKNQNWGQFDSDK